MNDFIENLKDFIVDYGGIIVTIAAIITMIGIAYGFFNGVFWN